MRCEKVNKKKEDNKPKLQQIKAHFFKPSFVSVLCTLKLSDVS